MMQKRLLSVLICCCLFVFLLTPAIAEKEFFSVLLLGIDENGLSEASQSKFGRSDAIMVAAMNTATNTIALASIDRDTATEISKDFAPAPGINKLCITTFFGGPALTLSCVNELFKLDVPYYIAIDKKGLRNVIDLLGGLDLEITKEERKEMPHIFRSSGKKHLTGKTVLEYVAWRDFDAGPSSDIARTERQRKVLTACLQQVKALGFANLTKLIPKIFPLVHTNIDVTGALLLAQSFLGNHSMQIRQMRFPQNAVRQVMNLHSVLLPEDWKKERQDLSAFLYQ